MVKINLLMFLLFIQFSCKNYNSNNNYINQDQSEYEGTISTRKRIKEIPNDNNLANERIIKVGDNAIQTEHKSTNTNCSLCGKWLTNTNVNGQNCNIVWKFDKDKFWTWDISCGSVNKTVRSKWKLDGEKLHELNGENIDKTEPYIIEWVSKKSFIATQVNNNDLLYEFEKVGNENSINITNKGQTTSKIICPVCLGRGDLPDQLGLDNSCLSSSELSSLFSGTIHGEGPPPKIYRRCCHCKGVGIVKNN